MHASKRAALAEALVSFLTEINAGTGGRAIAALERCGLTAGQSKTLAAIAAGATSISRLAEQLEITQPTASRFASALIGKRYVVASVCEHDRRARALAPTAEGREVLRTLREARVEDVRLYVDRLPGDQAERLAEALSSLTAVAIA